MNRKKCAACRSFSRICNTMHDSENIKFATAQQAKQIYQYKYTKEKLCKTKAAMGIN